MAVDCPCHSSLCRPVKQPLHLTLSLRTALGHIHHLIQAGTLRLRHRKDALYRTPSPHAHLQLSLYTIPYSSHCTSNLALPSFSRCTPTPGDQCRHSLDTRRNKSSVTAVTLASPRTAASRRGSPTSARDARLLCCWPAPRCSVWVWGLSSEAVLRCRPNLRWVGGMPLIPA